MSEQNFILREGLANWWSVEGGCIFYCEYDSGRFTPDLYSSMNVASYAAVSKAIRKRQAEHLAGRYCAQNALSTIGHDELEIKTGCRREPVWPPFVSGSISHDADAAVACVSDSPNIAGLGIDIEPIVSCNRALLLEGAILTQQDRFHYQQTRLQRGYFLTLVFSFKESFFKAAYPQVLRYFNFDALSLVSLDEENGTARFEILNTLCDSLRKGHEVEGRYREQHGRKLVTFIQL